MSVVNKHIKLDINESAKQLDEIKRYVRLVLEGVIEEDYKSNAEIKELANQTLIEFSKENYDHIERQSNLAEYQDGIKYFIGVRLNAVYHKNPDKFPILRDFLLKSNVIVNIRPQKDINTRGDYSANDEGEYKFGQIRYINLYFDESFAKKMAFEARKTTDAGDKVNYHDLYFPMFNAFNSTLMHELQHAYDDFRSNSKIFKSKQAADYKNKYFFAGQEINFHPEKETQKYNAYLVQPHEIWARFTQAIHDTRFYEVDFKGDTIKYNMFPIEEAIRSFTIHMRGFELLDKDTQRRLIRKAAQFWHEEDNKIKEKNKKIATKQPEKELEEMFIGEEYPQNFDMGVFKSLKHFTQRIEYCRNRLPRIAAGSSRIVYKIDDEKVLKLAKNKKGIAQNETEIDRGNDSYFSSILAKVFDSDEDGLWVEMELARKITIGDFKRITGFDIDDVKSYLMNFEMENRGRKPLFNIKPEIEEALDNDEYIQSLREFIAGTDAFAADLGVASSYGLVHREGSDSLVLIDFGVTQSMYSTHYDKSGIYEKLNEIKKFINNIKKN